MDQGETKFRIKAENKAKAHQAVRGLLAKTSKMSGFASSGSSVTRHFSWVDMDELRTTKTIEGQLKAWRWEADTDEKTGDVVNLHFRGEKLGDDTVLFGALAPFVEDWEFHPDERRGRRGSGAGVSPTASSARSHRRRGDRHRAAGIALLAQIDAWLARARTSRKEAP